MLLNLVGITVWIVVPGRVCCHVDIHDFWVHVHIDVHSDVLCLVILRHAVGIVLLVRVVVVV